MLWKCSVCGYINAGRDNYETCPKCSAPKKSFLILSEVETKKVVDSERTNDIHTEIIQLAMQIRKLANNGLRLGLDEPCISVFSNAYKEASVIRQRSKAELAGHINRGKW